MSKNRIKELIENLKTEADEYSCGYFIEEAECMEGVEYEVMCQGLVLDERRWYLLKETIIKVGDKYIGILWDDPATECQDGQETNIDFYEVEPVEKVIIEYKKIKKEEKNNK